jgi:chorismate mutase/prephenate dehydratase
MRKKSYQVVLNQLKKKRKKIDLIDQKLLSLLNQRLHIALEIGKIKKQTGMKIYDPMREKKILEGLKSRNKGPLEANDLEKIFVTIIKACRQSQR